MNIAYLSTGGNVGDRKKALEDAQNHLLSKGIMMVWVSSMYETEPWGNFNQPNFLNQVMKVKTELNPLELLEVCLSTERALGRVRTSKWEERIVDIDILFFGKEIINIDHLMIPHPRIEKRKFVLVPFCEFEPEFIHPVLKVSMRDLLETCEDELVVSKLIQ